MLVIILLFIILWISFQFKKFFSVLTRSEFPNSCQRSEYSIQANLTFKPSNLNTQSYKKMYPRFDSGGGKFISSYKRPKIHISKKNRYFKISEFLTFPCHIWRVLHQFSRFFLYSTSSRVRLGLNY